MHLYEISAEMRRALHELEIAEEQGDAEAYEAAMLKLSGLQLDRDEKLAACCKYAQELNAEVNAISGEMDRLKGMAERAEKRLEDWKAYVGACLGAGETWKGRGFALSWRKSEAVKVADEAKLPDLYWRERIVREPDKKAISADIKAGATIPGAVLEVRQNLQIK